MDIEEEFNLLNEYIDYFIDANYEKTLYEINFQNWEKEGKHGPSPHLNVRNVRYIEPMSFKAWAYYTKDITLD